MSKRNEIVRKSKGSAGSFFFGTFIGFILCIALLAGVGCFVYFKVSPNWINNKFKTNINLGSEEVNNLTLNDAVKKLTYISQNSNTYTLNDLNKDFGLNIADTVMDTINIASLKNVPLNKLLTEATNLVSNISAYELRNVVNLDDLDSLLSKKNVYYFNAEDKQLYCDKQSDSYVNLVNQDEIAYSYNQAANAIEIKGEQFQIVGDVVEIEIRFLPLTKMLSDYSGFTVAEVLSFKKNGDVYYDDINNNNLLDEGEELTGVMKVIANKKIGELQNEINNLTIAEFLDLKVSDGVYYNDANNNDTIDVGERVEPILNAIASTKISNLTEKINDLTIQDLFSSDDFNSGVLSLISDKKTEKVSNIATVLGDAIKDTPLQTLHAKGVITLDNNAQSKLNESIEYKGSQTTIGKLNLSEFVDYTLTKLDELESELNNYKSI